MQPLPALITILSLFMYSAFIVNVGRARGKYGIKAPATTGNVDFERYYRVQMNTLEMLVVFLPALWVFSYIWFAPALASALGAIWIIGRALYAIGYYKEAKKRELGFFISLFALAILLLGSLAGILKSLFIG